MESAVVVSRQPDRIRNRMPSRRLSVVKEAQCDGDAHRDGGAEDDRTIGRSRTTAETTSFPIALQTGFRPLPAFRPARFLEAAGGNGKGSVGRPGSGRVRFPRILTGMVESGIMDIGCSTELRGH